MRALFVLRLWSPLTVRRFAVALRCVSTLNHLIIMLLCGARASTLRLFVWRTASQCGNRMNALYFMAPGAFLCVCDAMRCADGRSTSQYMCVCVCVCGIGACIIRMITRWYWRCPLLWLLLCCCHHGCGSRECITIES